MNLEGDGQDYPPGLRASNQGFLPISLDEYLELLDWSGRSLHPHKRGAIPGSLPPILERLGIQEKGYLAGLRDFSSWFKTAVGGAASLARLARRLGRRWVHGVRLSQQAFSQ